jgi:hypothetical protein
MIIVINFKTSFVKRVFTDLGLSGIKDFHNGKLRNELPDRGIFDTLDESRVLIERRRVEYNTI